MLPPPPHSTLFPYTTLFRSYQRFESAVAVALTFVIGFIILVALYRLASTVVVGMLTTTVEARRSEEHTSELQSHHDLVCRLLLEKKKDNEREEPANRIVKTH